MTRASADVLDCLGSLQEVVMTVSVQRTRTGASAGLTNHQMAILGAAMAAPGCTVSDIAASTRNVLPAASRTLRSLEQRGLVERRRDATDQRIVRIHARPKANKLVAKIHEELAAMLSDAIAPLAPRERDTMVEGLRTLANALRQSDPRGA